LDDATFPASAGEQLRDFCYVDDSVRAILQALTHPEVEGDVFNVASGIPVSIREIVEIVGNIIGSGNPQYGDVPYRNGENMALYANISKAKRLLNWESTITLKIGLRKTIDWFKDNAC
jgi:UDP-glucose 4-epimerase